MRAGGQACPGAHVHTRACARVCACVRPSSGYRCLELNRKLGSSDKSQHTRGQACDIEIPTVSNYELGVWVRDNLNYDTVLLEFYKEDVPSSGWVHVSYVSEENNRKRALTFDGKEYKTL